jgi:hypothetical protein
VASQFTILGSGERLNGSEMMFVSSRYRMRSNGFSGSNGVFNHGALTN